VPVPLQFAGCVSVVPVQLCARHRVLAPGNAPHAVRLAAVHCAWHAPEPVQAPREPCGWPEVTGEQVPTLPSTSHASQVPLHARSQQTPSTQLPDLHCPGVQAWPFTLPAAGSHAVPPALHP
jgi:hypothetical protein